MKGTEDLDASATEGASRWRAIQVAVQFNRPPPAVKKGEDTALPISDIPLATQDRRRHLRFPTNADLRYKVVVRGRGAPTTGTGKALDISSQGLAFRTCRPLKTGSRLAVSMDWPVTLDDQTMLRLVFEGVVLRVRGGLVAMSIERPQFVLPEKEHRKRAR